MDTPNNIQDEILTDLQDKKGNEDKTSLKDIWFLLLAMAVWGAAWLFAAAKDIFPSFPGPDQSFYGYLVAYVISLIGLGVGWRQYFPRWSYLYAGFALTFAAYWAGIGMKGWRILGFEFPSDGSWSWRAWVPLALLVVIMLVITRSQEPLRCFFKNIKREWSHLSLLLFAWLASLTMTVTLDSIELAHEFWSPVILFAGFILGVLLYTQAKGSWKRASGLDIGLLVGFLGSILVDQILSPETTMFPVLSTIAIKDRPLYYLGMAGWIIVLFGLVFLPALFNRAWSRKKVASVH